MFLSFGVFDSSISRCVPKVIFTCIFLAKSCSKSPVLCFLGGFSMASAALLQHWELATADSKSHFIIVVNCTSTRRRYSLLCGKPTFIKIAEDGIWCRCLVASFWRMHLLAYIVVRIIGRWNVETRGI